MKRRIYQAEDFVTCGMCGDYWCERHHMHWADCVCLSEIEAEDLGYEVVEEKGKLYART